MDMRKFQKNLWLYGILTGLLIAALVIPPLRAQQQGIIPTGAIPVTQTATRADAAISCQTSASTGGTLTFAAQPGLYFYLTEMDVQNVVGGSAVSAAAQTTITTTNLPGSPNWTMASGTTAGTNTQSFSVEWPTGLKSTVVATNTVITLPTFATNQTIRVNACGFYA